MSMKALVTSYPALGQVTKVKGGKAHITVALDVDESRVSDGWEVLLWYSKTNNDWEELPLHVSSVLDDTPISLDLPSAVSQGRIYFTALLDVATTTSFTIKFRNGSNQPWRWIKEHQGYLDGTMIPMVEKHVTAQVTNLADLIAYHNPIFEVEHVSVDIPGTSIWSITAPIEAAKGENSAFLDVKFGKPWSGDIIRWFALIRTWTPWLAPRQGRSHFELDKDAIVCSFMEPGGRHLVLLAISGVDDVTTVFKSDQNENVMFNIRNDRATDGLARVVVSLGHDFESAMKAAMAYARVIIYDNKKVTGNEQEEKGALKHDVEAQWMENWFDGLTYCTWNGLGQQLNEDKIIKAVDTLASKQINITNLIIDDNWQSIDHNGQGQFQHGWVEFEADRNNFPNGLKHTVSAIRSKHRHIQHIAVWHAMLGYWGGISPNGTIAKSYKTVQAVRVDSERRRLPEGGKITVVAKDDVHKMYEDFYTFLSSCGINAVKTDAQFMLDTLGCAIDRVDLYNTYLDAWNISSMRHFSTKAISCMSQTPQIIFHSQLPTNQPAIVVRNSDDFFPEVDSSHPWHVFTNACNSLLTQHLNVLPDWDMFQTVHSYSGFHAAARCVSGGPISITDVPGEHDVELLKQMTAQTPRGKTVILRPGVGKNIDAYMGYNDEVLLKIGTYHGATPTGTSMLGIFNISPRPLSEFLPLLHFPHVVEAQLYVVRSHNTGLVSRPMQVVDPSPPSSLLDIHLGVRGYDILSAFPLRGFVVHDQTTWIANLGLLGKMTGAAAVLSTHMTIQHSGRIDFVTSLKALGILGIYISNLPERTVASSFLIMILGQIVPEHVVTVSKLDAKLLEIDLETAWQEMDLSSGWSNEVQVKLYLNPI